MGGLGVQQESAREAAGGGEAPSKVGASDSVNGDVSDGGVLSSQTARGPWAVGVRDRVGAQTCPRVRPPAEQSGRQVGCEGLIIQSLEQRLSHVGLALALPLEFALPFIIPSDLVLRKLVAFCLPFPSLP